MMTVGGELDSASDHALRVEAVYRRVHDRLWRSLLASCRDPEIASDAEAEAFAQVLRRGDEVVDVERWVWRSALRILDGMMVRSPAPASDVGPVGLGPSTVEFLDLVSELSAQQRKIVVLRYVAQLTPSEIAGAIDSSAGSVRVQLHRAHRSLRSSLDNNEQS